MDPLAMAGSALSILNAIKEQVKECEACFQEAAALNEMIKGFEVVLMMIPSRATTDDDLIEEENEEEERGEMGMVGRMTSGVAHMAGTIGDALGENVDQKGAIEHGKNYAKEQALSMLGEGAEVAFELFTIGKDLEPIFNDEPNPGLKLQAMKEEVDASNMRVYSDLEVMFQGMAYTVLAALQVINGAVDQLKVLDKLGTPTSYWACMPWKVSQTLAIKEDLNGHVDDLKHQINMLQTAIGVASYAVQLEQMESMMDSTSALKHRDVRSLWKKRIGSDKSKVPLMEFVDAFFCEKPAVLTVNKHFEETIARRKDPNIALGRFLADLVNENNDDDISVYELNSVMQSAEKHNKFLKPLDAVGYTIHSIQDSEKQLLKAIHFYNVQIESGDDGVFGTNDDQATVIPNGEALVVRPFHKALIIAEIPLFDQQVYQFDSLVLLQFQNPKNPLSCKLKDHYEFDVMEETRCYLSKDTSSLVISTDESKWNAYKSFKSVCPPRFDKRFNFEQFKKSKMKLKKKQIMAMAGVEMDELDDIVSPTNMLSSGGGGKEKEEEEEKKEVSTTGDEIMMVAHDDDEDEEEEDANDKLVNVSFDDRIRILYSPSMMYPGNYSPRYCLDAYQDQNDGLLKKKLSISARSYYKGNVEGVNDDAVDSSQDRARAKTVAKKRRTSVAMKTILDDEINETDKRALEKLGPVVYVPDVNEMVFGEQIHEESMNDPSNDNDELVHYSPHLSKTYPYLPKRTIWIPFAEDLEDNFSNISVFINRKQTRKRERLESKVSLPDDCTHVGLFMDSGRKEPDAKGRPKTVWTFVKERRIDDDDPNHLFHMSELVNNESSVGYHDNDAREYRICFTKRSRVQGQQTVYFPLLSDRETYPFLTVWVGKEEPTETLLDSSDISSDDESDDDEDRPPHPGSFTISGATGKSAARVNGIFEPSHEIQIGLPVYRKKNDPDTWVEAVKGVSGYRWYLKPAANKGPNSSICFAYVAIDEENLALPLDITTPWTINTANGFAEQKSIVVFKASDKPTPFLLEELVSSAQLAVNEHIALAKAEREREPYAGSFTISKATGKSEARINGTFEPTDEVQLGLPVYKKKGDDSTFVEACRGANLEGELRWYLKPAANRGAESSICFAYVEIDLKAASLPDKMGNTPWKVNTADGWEDQDIGLTSASGLALPGRIADMVEIKRKELAEEARIQDLELTRPPLAGSFSVTGATGTNKDKINGVFEPTDEVQNDLPVYVMKGSGNMWIEAVKGNSGWRWYVKPTANKGPESSVCFAYAQFDDENVVLPQDIPGNEWTVYADKQWVKQSTLSVSLESALPAAVESQYARGKKIIESEATRLRQLEKRKEDEDIESTRAPYPGSFRISGSTGKSAKRMNGVFEPSDEVQIGLPVFVKKGDPDTWVEAVSGTSGLRWYLKPAANKGPKSSICFGYIAIDQDNVVLPQNMSPTDWTVNTDSGFVAQKTVVESASNEAVPEKIISLVKEAANEFGEKARKLRQELERDPIAGSFSMSNATGKNSDKVNGTFEPTKETQNGFPVYKKKGDDGHWVEAVKGTSGWRWYLKPTANKGPDSSICFAYLNFNADNVGLPPDVGGKWTVHCTEGFVEQSVVCVSVGGSSERVMNLLSSAKRKIIEEDLLKKEELNRTAMPGSFTISGATGKSENSVNGTFEPTEEIQNGLPVYKLKGNDGLWVEAVKGASGWRWYLKPVKNKGPDSSICFAYIDFTPTTLALPQYVDGVWTVSCTEGFVKQTTISTVSVGGESDRLSALVNDVRAKLLEEEEVLKQEMEKPPIPGSFSISGAEGSSAGSVNGIFEPIAGEEQLGLPVYRKKGPGNLICEAAKGASGGLRWYVKPVANRGPESTVCFGYCAIDENSQALPHDILTGWTVNTKDGFQMQETIVVSLASSEPIPENMTINPLH